MTEREELVAILRDRQRIINSPEAHVMRGGLNDEQVTELLAKWRTRVKPDLGEGYQRMPVNASRLAKSSERA
ncbi:MAG: hypothetical protein Q8R02_23515 [Hyphomonadaceae bacterium]|nr:hypothetical protein [Hyphomonadaceae bacterium]